jgi:hypothetical protein
MIPFVFRSDRVVNVWITLDSGRRAEFDVLLRGTFKVFNIMAKNKEFLDIVIPIESKYGQVLPEHVNTFDDKITQVFGSTAGNVIPIMIGLGWTKEALDLARKLGILTIYFTAIDNLITEIAGKRYRIGSEWEHAKKRINSGELTLEELRSQINKMEYKYLFEKEIENRLGTKINSSWIEKK